MKLLILKLDCHTRETTVQKPSTSLETLVAIANALNTSVDEFLSDTVSNSQVIFNDELKTVLERADMEELKVICKLARVILKKD